MRENATDTRDTRIISDSFEPEDDSTAAEDAVFVKDGNGKSVRLEVSDDAEDDPAQ